MPGYNKSAKCYDLIYYDKDYAKECKFIENIFKKYSKRKIRSILDLGCGTGSHSIRLAGKGFDVVGVDISKKMIQEARLKSKKSTKVKFLARPMQKFILNKKFDACVSMFTSINYLLSYKDIKSTLLNVKRQLKKNGLFIFDCWNAVAVMRHFLPLRCKIYQNKNNKIIRISETKINKLKRICDVKWTYLIVEGDQIKRRFVERLRLRVSFLAEFTTLLDSCGFKILQVCPFMKISKKVSDNSFDIAIIARPKN